MPYMLADRVALGREVASEERAQKRVEGVHSFG